MDLRPLPPSFLATGEMICDLHRLEFRLIIRGVDYWLFGMIDRYSFHAAIVHDTLEFDMLMSNSTLVCENLVWSSGLETAKRPPF